MTRQIPELRAEDFVRSYDLAPTVDSTIPTQARPCEPGAHWVARGLMTETCAQLLGRPVRLEYFEHQHLTYVTAHVSLASTILSSDPLGAVVAVDLILGRPGGRWALLFTDRLIGTGAYLPSPRYLAGLVAADHDARRRPCTQTCRGTVERPTHLW